MGIYLSTRISGYSEMEVGGYEGAMGFPRPVVCSLNTVQPSLPGAFVCWSWEDRGQLMRDWWSLLVTETFPSVPAEV